jgi:hypothetical protein
MALRNALIDAIISHPKAFSPDFSNLVSSFTARRAQEKADQAQMRLI